MSIRLFSLKKMGDELAEHNSPVITTTQNNDTSKYLSLGENVSSKALGLGWYNGKDEFHFTSKIKIDFSNVTKRSILSAVSQIYDPLGLLDPVEMLFIRSGGEWKKFFCKIVASKVGWDDAPSQDIILHWKKFIESISNL